MFIEELLAQNEHLKEVKGSNKGGLSELASKFQQAESEIKHLSAVLKERELEINELVERNREIKLQKDNLEVHLEEVTMQFNEQRDELEQSLKTREADLKADKKRLQEEIDSKVTQFELKVAEFREREKSFNDDITLSRQQNKNLFQELETIKKGELTRVGPENQTRRTGVEIRDHHAGKREL